MRLLLDTHALLWWLTEDKQLGTQARELIGDVRTDVLVSMVSLWEMTVKARTGKLKVDVGRAWDTTIEAGFSVLGISIVHLRELAGLPVFHRDPFDHLLMAQARAEDALFLSEDRNVASYPVRYLRCSGA